MTETTKFKIGDILENPYNPRSADRYRRFIYMGTDSESVRGIKIDRKHLSYGKLFYKDTVLHPERQYDPEGRPFKVIGHSKGYEIMIEELGGLDK